MLKVMGTHNDFRSFAETQVNKMLAQHWVDAYNSFHLDINMPLFRLTSRINPSCQTDAVLITENKLKRDDSRAWF